jgi:hypothetical protein
MYQPCEEQFWRNAMTSSRFDHREEEESRKDGQQRNGTLVATTLACMQDNRVRVRPKLLPSWMKNPSRNTFFIHDILSFQNYYQTSASKGIEFRVIFIAGNSI